MPTTSGGSLLGARAVRFLAGEVGIRQFLDIGTGLPTTNSVHEVAQAVAPSSRASGVTGNARNADVFARLVFSGLELVPPGVVLVSE